MLAKGLTLDNMPRQNNLRVDIYTSFLAWNGDTTPNNIKNGSWTLLIWFSYIFDSNINATSASTPLNPTIPWRKQFLHKNTSHSQIATVFLESDFESLESLTNPTWECKKPIAKGNRFQVLQGIRINYHDLAGNLKNSVLIILIWKPVVNLLSCDWELDLWDKSIKLAISFW